MGYDLHVTRASSRPFSEGSPISQSEWELVVEAHPALHAGGNVVWADIGSQKGYSVDGVEAGLSWRKGKVDIWGQFPDRLYEVLIELAEILDAHLEGDDSERYRRDGTSYEVD